MEFKFPWALYTSRTQGSREEHRDIKYNDKGMAQVVRNGRSERIFARDAEFAVACYDGDDLCGVAICGRPVARYLDDGLTLEILRCCTDGTDNACSKLYGACCRIGFDMGYERIVTYTLATESGASLRAAGFAFDGVAGPTGGMLCQ